MYRAKTGIFKPRHPSKYRGDVNNIIYRSSWEMRCMKFFDETSDVIMWSSEELIVRYNDPLTGKERRYFPDFIIKIKTRDGKEEVRMIEIKPFKQTKPPEKPKRKTKRFLEETKTYLTNVSKWKAAQAFCSRRGWKFQVITERDLWKKS